MTIVPASRLSRADLCRLGNNVESVVRRDHSEMAAIDRSLPIHIEAAADVLRPEIELPSAVRWVRRRLCLVRATLILALTLLDVGVAEARVSAVRTAWDTDRALVTLRVRAASHLAAWPRPLGFGPHRSARDAGRRGVPHAMGPDATGPPE